MSENRCPKVAGNLALVSYRGSEEVACRRSPARIRLAATGPRAFLLIPLMATMGLWACRTVPSRRVHFVIAEGYVGVAKLILDPRNGVDVKPQNGLYIYQLPFSGFLRVKSLTPLRNPHVTTAAYTTGATLPVGSDHRPAEAVALRYLGESVRRDGVRTLAFVIGTGKDVIDLRKAMTTPAFDFIPIQSFDWAAVTANYKIALRHALVTVPVARQFLELFPVAQTFFSYYTGTAGPPTLNCVASLYGRYELTLQMPVIFDATRTRVVSQGNQSFSLNEVASVTHESDGRFYVEYGELHRHFGTAEWTRLYAAHGDLAVLGMQLIKDKPAPNFDAYWKEELAKNPI